MKEGVAVDVLSFTQLRSSDGTHFSEYCDLAGAFGLDSLAVRVERLEPGKAASAWHRHTNLEEGLLVLDGEVEVQLGATRTRIRKGSFYAFPAGGPPHRVVNCTDSRATFITMAAGGAEDEVLYGAPNAD